jgi:hypothetical protein
MDQVALVSDQVEVGRRLLDRLIADGTEVTAAAWVYPTDQERWVLYIALPVVDAQGLRAGMGRIHTALNRIGWDGLSTGDVWPVGASHPVAAQLLDIYHQRPSQTGIRFIGPRLGDVYIEDAYIYARPPAPVPGGRAMTTDEVVRKMTDLMNRTGVAQPATVSLRNSTTFQGVPYGMEKNNEVLTLKFIETGSGYVRSIPVSDVASVT